MKDEYYMHRPLCDVLEDMRMCHKTRTYGHLLGLIEEAQAMGSRMEAALGENADMRKIRAEWQKVTKAATALEKLRSELEEQVEALEKQVAA